MPTTPTSPLDRFRRVTSATTTSVPRLIWSGVGGPGAGKTQFGLTGPAPIVVQSLDWGLEGVVEKFQDKKEIRVVDYDWAPSAEDEREADFQKNAIELRDRFIEDFVFACHNARTVLWDKETDVWNLFRYAQFGSPKADVPRDFDKVNQLMRKYVNYPKKLTINFGLIEDVREEWKSQNAKSGTVKRAGFREVEGLVHVDLFHYREGGKFMTTVGKARGEGSKEVQDKTFENLDIPTLGMLLFPDTDTEDWE